MRTIMPFLLAILTLLSAPASTAAETTLSCTNQKTSTEVPVFTRANAEQEERDQPVTEEDLQILTCADTLLASEEVWNRNDDRVCDDDESTGVRSLFCALQAASIAVLGKYDHRRVALQEVRFAVVDASPGREFHHRLMDFNNFPETGFDDVKQVLAAARERVRSRLTENSPGTSP